MKDLDINKLVVIEALPKIMEQLDVLGEYIDEGLKDIDKLECNEENKQLVKKKRTEINNTLKILEDKRKDIKNKILAPYETFNSKFEDVAKIKLQNASQMLSDKINEIENAQKEDKINMLMEFAERQFKANEIQDVVKFDDIGLNITLSASEKSLKDQIVAFCERIRNDLDTILLEDLKDEIYVEYKKCLSYTIAKQTVMQRHKDLEVAKEQNEQRQITNEQVKKMQSAVYEVIESNLDDLKIPDIYEVETTPPSDKDDILIVTFTIKDTKEKLKMLKQFMIDNNIKYE